MVLSYAVQASDMLSIKNKSNRDANGILAKSLNRNLVGLNIRYNNLLYIYIYAGQSLFPNSSKSVWDRYKHSDPAICRDC